MKRYRNLTIDGYKIEIKDYQYKRRPPVGVFVSGTRLGECTNLFGEPCYFYQHEDAMNLDAGEQLGRAIVAAQKTKA